MSIMTKKWPSLRNFFQTYAKPMKHLKFITSVTPLGLLFLHPVSTLLEPSLLRDTPPFKHKLHLYIFSHNYFFFKIH